ncbi:MAG TPA: hypothetical protein VK422_20045 [Pyrinomonadaceae bacterium]|nr:hypothetical protein [Pyrinomonadaceae bacterium]
MYEERAAYVVTGSVELPGGEGPHEAGRLLVFRPGEAITLKATEAELIPLPESKPAPVVRYP